jgi:hypothetical protein
MYHTFERLPEKNLDDRPASEVKYLVFPGRKI